MIFSQCPASVNPTENPSTSDSSVTTTKPIPIDYRLPTNLVPRYYDIELSIPFGPFEEPNNFQGKVEIRFDCTTPTNKLTIHLKDLKLENNYIRVKGLTDSSFDEITTSWSYDDVREFFIATLSKNFQAGHSYSAIIEYAGIVSDNGLGLYKSYFYDKNGNKR